MRAQPAAIALAALLLLAGCVATPPPGPSADEVEAFNERMLDLTWKGTGLSGERPVVNRTEALVMNEWIDATFACMSQSGIGDFSLSYGPDQGYALFGSDGGGVSAADQLAFYECAAARSVLVTDELLSNAQLDYIYDYYLRSLVPCMVMNGFRPTMAPTRIEFHAIAGQWSPYYSVDVGLSGVQYEQIESVCGAERPELY